MIRTDSIMMDLTKMAFTSKQTQNSIKKVSIFLDIMKMDMIKKAIMRKDLIKQDLIVVVSTKKESIKVQKQNMIKSFEILKVMY